MFTGTRAQKPADRSWCPVGKGDKDLWVGCADNGGCLCDVDNRVDLHRSPDPLLSGWKPEHSSNF